MKRTAYSVQRIVLIVLSGVFLILSFPNFNLEYLAWIGLIPLFFAIENQKPLKAFLLSYLCGILFFLGAIYWLIHVTLPGMIVVVLYLALYFGVFGLIFSYTLQHRTYSLLYIPALWVTLELVRSHLFGGFGWALLGHSQSFNLPVIQIADITGAYGVSFLVVLVNAGIFLTIQSLGRRKFQAVYVIVTVSLVLISLAYGIIRLKNIFIGERLRVAVIQGNIPQAKKWDLNFRENILLKYEALTLQAFKENVDIVIWPETSVPGYLKTERDLLYRLEYLAKSMRKPILVGAPLEDTDKKDTYYNGAVLFSEDGSIAGQYYKIHLVPFGEYIPFKNVLNFVERFARSPIGDFTGGSDYTVFKFFVERGARSKEVTWKLVKKAKFSCLICFEDIFPGLTRQFVKNRADFLVNITNDAWFGNTSAPYQHAQSSVFRAVENRTNVVRAANTGLSCFIDQKGRISDVVTVNGRNLFVEGFKVHDITLAETKTFYTLYGDVFAYICVLVTIAGIFRRSSPQIPVQTSIRNSL